MSLLKVLLFFKLHFSLPQCSARTSRSRQTPLHPACCTKLLTLWHIRVEHLQFNWTSNAVMVSFHINIPSFHPSLLDRPVRRDYDLRLSWRSAAVETRKLHAEKDNWDLRFYLPLISVWGCWWGGWCWTLPAIAWEGGPWPVRDGGWQTGCSFLTNTNNALFRCASISWIHVGDSVEWVMF